MTTWHSDEEPLEQSLAHLPRGGVLSGREALKARRGTGNCCTCHRSGTRRPRAERASSATNNTRAATLLLTAVEP